MKKALIIVFALVVVVAVAIVYLYSSLDSIIKAAIEKVGSDLTQTEVVLNEVEISPTSGTGALRGFRVTNPSGFSDDDAFRFDSVTVKIAISTIKSDPVVINEIVIDGPRIIYEFGNGSSNLDTLKNNVQQQTAGSGGSSGASDSSGSDGPKIVIENLYLRNGVVGVTAPVLKQKMEVPLPTVHLKDIGKDGKGATPSEVTQKIIDAVLASATKAVTNANLNLGDLRKTADQISGEAMKKVDEATKGMTDSIGKDAGKSMEGLIKGLGK